MSTGLLNSLMSTNTRTGPHQALETKESCSYTSPNCPGTAPLLFQHTYSQQEAGTPSRISRTSPCLTLL